MYSGRKIEVKINDKLSEDTTNREDGRGSPLSPTLFNININEIIVKSNHIYTKGITTTTTKNTLPFSDSQVIIVDSEDNLQRGVFALQSVAKDFRMEMSP